MNKITQVCNTTSTATVLKSKYRPWGSALTNVDLNAFRLTDGRVYDHQFFSNNAKVLQGPNKVEKNGWANFKSEDRKISGWKMHIYADNEADWQHLASVVAPYLQQRGMEWKTIDKNVYLDRVDKTSPQYGKAFAIYFKTGQDMINTANDLDYIISNNKLEIGESQIQGDKKIGTTGRLFYRYSLKDGRYKNRVFDLNNPQDEQDFFENSVSNRGGDKYLPPDMNMKEDDPLYGVVFKAA